MLQDLLNCTAALTTGWTRKGIAKAAIRGRTRQLGVERLENRQLMAVTSSFNSTTKTLSVYGDIHHNDLEVVKLSDGRIRVQGESTPSNGFSLTPIPYGKTFSLADSNKMERVYFRGSDGADSMDNEVSTLSAEFYGDKGNDRLLGSSKADRLYGGPDDDYLFGDKGNDFLDGNDGNDLIYGGSDHDTIYGGNHHDTMYGGSGDDKLYGGEGSDGLYGGSDSDVLWGQGGADRFLVMNGQSEHKDAVSADAVLRFKNGDQTWTTSEIENVDKGLKALHLRTLNDNLLERANGVSITFTRRQFWSDTVAARNLGTGEIILYDRAFRAKDIAAVVVIHEMGHNWDTEHSRWSTWLTYAGWRTNGGTGYTHAGDSSVSWYYKNSLTSVFTRDYGKNTPQDDWCTSWESYFSASPKYGLTNSYSNKALTAAKRTHLDQFFNSISG